MKYLEYKETIQRGTPEFPYAYYHITKTHPRYNMMHHWHPQSEIIYVLQGRFDVFINDREYTAKAGDALFVSGGMMHGGTPDDAEYECLVFDIDPFLRKCLMTEERAAEIVTNVKPPAPTVLCGNDELMRVIERIFSELRGRKSGYKLKVQGCVLELYGELARLGSGEMPQNISGNRSRRLNSLKNALSYIEEHYSEQITLADIAAASGLNSGYLCRFFREMTHMTPIEYLNCYRVECACEQIASTNDSITDIALSCGFGDLSYFIKVFRKFKGVTPSAYGKFS
ncbi:MAG: AraC family transcriptional regulator [Clostridia bacterium]|nr:AraC family transcriptional regulator [Clostridia bacterium]